MSSIRLATAANVLAFQNLTTALNTSESRWTHLIENDGLQDEIGRFRVWSGNLGALQKGHSSLDYRLRDSPLLSTNTLKFLKELEENINEASAIVSGARLPYELQPKPEVAEEEEEDDDFFDKDEEDDEDTGSRTELSMRFSEIVDIIDNLYKLSVRIRTPTIRTRSAKAATFKPKDPETGVDILSTYADYDLQHVKELLRHLRQPHEGETDGADYDYLTTRLSAAITLRRRQFKYWKRHRDKLGMSTVQEEATPLEQPTMDRPAMPQRHDTLEALPGTPLIVRNQDAPSQKTGKTLLSGTEATQHHQSLDEIVDTKSVTSYAVTVKDLHGKGVDLPPPPRAADSEKDFECPYCYIICPARYGRGRAWRTHLLQDLQPYVCTYPDCDSSEQLFRSRREWADHEATHRKAWRCPEHPNAIYKTSAGLEDHFQREHGDSFPESQLPAIVKVGETTTLDARKTCPICSAPADIDGLGDFHNHIANHLERLATFALPNGRGDDSDEASSAASRGRSESSESRDMSDLSLPIDDGDKLDHDSQKASSVLPTPEDVNLADNQSQDATPRAVLSAESLQQLPDASQERLGALFPSSGNQLDDRSRSGSGSEDSSYYEPDSYAKGDEQASKLNTLNLADIPTIRSLYRTRRLQQRDQSFAPNDKYNQIISFCHHDLTKLKVDAIVNSANKSLKMTRGDTLNNTIHVAAGPGLSIEARSMGRRLEGQALITGGHNLPSKHVIHVLRPGYFRHRGMGEFNQLIDCYREVLKVATENKIKTIGIPCLGTGGVGFPARVAARITLQEMREYLDAHPEHNLERIIFCVNTAADEKAYIDFLPVYFPPTHDDLDSARGIWSEDYAAQAMKILDTRNEVQKVFSDLNLGLSLSVTDFPQDILTHLAAIDSSLSSIRRFLLWSNDVNKNIRDLKLVCTVLMLFCGNITEIIDLAKDHAKLGQRSDKSIWDDYVADMNTRLQTNPSELLQLCRDLLEALDNMITGLGYDLDEIMEMVETRQKLEHYKVKQRGGRQGEGNQDHLNEVLLTREFQNESIAQSRDSVKLYQIRSVAQLYKLGELEEKPTQAKPSAVFNDKVYLVREDITKLEVDIMVNSTDASFRGMGTLDRTVLQKGGEEMRAAVTAFGQCKVGEVRCTEGYMLPAKHVLHIIPADRYNGGTKIVLKKLYREILQEAVSMRATSIALPSIGTGMLNYPRRDVASLALEEAKRFLESAERDNPVEKIIFVVFSSNDEFVYKSLMPVYFPPINDDLGASARTIARQDTGMSATSSASDAPRRTLFGSIGEALRSVRLGKQPQATRPITANEEQALIRFESHAKECETCQDIDRLYLEKRDLCMTGYSRAQTVLWYLNMQSDQNVYTKPDIRGQSTKLELSMDMFPISMRMLSAVEKSQGDKTRSRPFVAQHRPYGAVTQDQAVDTPSSTGDDTSIPQGPKKFRARVLATLDSTSTPTPVSSQECHIQVHPDRVDVFQQGSENELQWPLLSLSLSDSSVVSRLRTTPELQLDGVDRLPTSTMSETTGKLIFRCRNDKECNALLRTVRHVIVRIQTANYSGGREQAISPDSDAESRDGPAFIQPVKTLVQKKLADDEDVMSLGDKVNVSSAKISIYSGFGEDGEFPVLLTLQLHASSTIQQYTKWAEITLAGATHSPSFFNTEGIVTFICKNNEDRDVLLLRIQREIMRLQGSRDARDEETTVTPPVDAEDGPSSEPIQWTKRLSAIRSELAGVKRASGGLSDLQYKIERLSTATAPLSTDAQASSDASNLFDPSRSELATRILLCLTADLKSRPGSYIGLDTNSIIAAVRAEEQEVRLALEVLVGENQIHNTVDVNTWVITHPPADLPVLSGEEPESGPQSVGVPYDEPRQKEEKAARYGLAPEAKVVACNACDLVKSFGPVSSSRQPKPEVTLQDLDPTAQTVYNDLVESLKIHKVGKHVLQIASSTGRTRVEVENALAILTRCGFVHTHGEWWAVTMKFQQSDGEEGDAETAIKTAVSDARGAPSELETAGPSIPKDTAPSQKGKEPESSEQAEPNITLDQSGTNRPQVQLNPTTEKVYTYLLNYTFAPPDGAHHILDIAAAVYLTREEVRQSLAELKDLGLANVSGKNGWWWATKADAPQPPGEEGQHQSLPNSRPKAAVREIPNIRVTDVHSPEEIGPDFASFGVAQSTSPAFHDAWGWDGSTIHDLPRAMESEQVFREMASGEKGEDKEKEKENTAAATASDTPAPQAQPPIPLPLDLDTITITSHIRYTQPFGTRSTAARWTRIDRRLLAQRVLVAANEEFHHVDGDIVFHRVVPHPLLERWFEETKALRKMGGGSGGEGEGKSRGMDEGKGKGKEGERDAEQERLDRVIAGDIREDEMRRYEDEKDAEGKQRRHMYG